ncbi:kinase domain protein (macronuclear) [Tetrahymena thermophila SB210]|uniref:Kinase domain protein n=1 Tax=Tetrahymena thermophila (strain SB210) TaxID=312017 RepID=I7MJP2_TETTS|nr:kinase domain protein [Tetrahymena thermophila SB210]EAR96497.2 kinase domain protein [Tetrahymena thermophila SB210]|eukprot:XP_001016742.2 kinase domain protein [Tetrahymena thermophila SB210]
MKWIRALYHFTQVANSIKQLHILNLCHCNIKIDNILVEQYSNGFKDILIGFGYCQKIKQNELSQAYNSFELNEGFAQSQVKPYNPYKLDLYQLGMLLLTLITCLKIPNKIKNVISSNKKNIFLRIILSQYREQYNTELLMQSEVFDLIWDLLTGQIEDVAQIFHHQVYNLQEVKNMLKDLPQTGNKKVFQIEEEFNNIFIRKNEDGNRNDNTISINKEFNNMLKSNCTRYDELIQEIKFFCDKNPRQIKERELKTRSFLFEMKTSQILQHLLYCFGKNNSEVFDQNIFGQTQDLTLKVTLKYISKDVIIEEGTDDDNEEYLQELEIEEIQNNIEFQIEIVMIEELKQSEIKSIIFTPIKGESIYYNNLIEDLSRDLQKII